jgi:dihydrofolate reductase
MGKLIVAEWMSLDGVVQGPSSPDEDTEGGFAHGGWHTDYFDDGAMRWTLENVSNAAAYLLGRRTYEIFAAHWPNAGDDEQAFAEPLNTRPKYVASTTLAEPLEWQNASLLKGETEEAVRALKTEVSGDVLVVGSTVLVRTLLAHNLVDDFRLMVDPLIIGSGKRLFGDDGDLRRLELVEAQPTTTGAVLATYTASRSSE